MSQNLTLSLEIYVPPMDIHWTILNLQVTEGIRSWESKSKLYLVFCVCVVKSTSLIGWQSGAGGCSKEYKKEEYQKNVEPETGDETCRDTCRLEAGYIDNLRTRTCIYIYITLILFPFYILALFISHEFSFILAPHSRNSSLASFSSCATLVKVTALATLCEQPHIYSFRHGKNICLQQD